MSGGVDIRSGEIVVATADGTRRYRNAVRAVDDEAVDESALTVEVSGAVYGVGDATPDSDVTRLFGGEHEHDTELMASALDALLGADETPLGDDRYGYVGRDPETRRHLSQLATDRAFDILPVDPGMAVCYDAFDAPPEGLGVALDGGRARATLAVGGVPVATATVTYRGRWYDVTDAVDDVGAGGVRAAWSREQYRALLAAVAGELAGRAPALSGPVAVALGGGAAPAGLTAADLRGVGDALGVTVASVTVAGSPGEAPARGALVAARADRSGAVPAFAATDAYAPGLADTEATTAAFADALADEATGGEERPETPAGETVSERSGGSAGGPRREGRLGLALGAVVDGLDGETDTLRQQIAEIETGVERVRADLRGLEAETADRETVEALGEAVDQTEQRVDALADDIAEIQTALAGVDGASVEGADPAGAFESVAVEAVREELDAVEGDLTERIEALWTETDELSDQLVDVSARLEDLPELESSLESTDASVEALHERIGELQRSLSGLGERVDDVETRMATGEDVASLRAEIADIESQVDTVREHLRSADWVEPAELDSQARDLDALRETVVDHARRLEGVEQSTSDLDDRLEQVFRDTAKAEALSSLQAEVSRLQNERPTDADDGIEADEVQARLDGLSEELDQFREMVDSVAERSVTRSEFDETRTAFETRLTDLETASQQEPAPETETGSENTFLRPLLAVALVSTAGLGSLLALEFDRPEIALGFAVFVAGPAVLLWLADRGDG